MTRVNSARSWVVFGAAVFAYLVAVLHRTSLGVAGVEATDRFGATAAALSALAVIQLLVYAALQVPVGALVDVVGARLLILIGAALMCAGQVLLAIAPDLVLAAGGRLLVGAGDAMTFIPAVRLLATWFSGRTLPIVTQLLGTSGQLGQILSALPLVAVLHTWGWTPTYLGIAALSVVAIAVVLIAVVADRPAPGSAPSVRSTLGHVREAITRPGTQLGFWTHFVSQPSGAMFAWLWGFPFLSVALGYGATAAGLLLMLIVATAAIAGPALGILSARFPLRRSSIVLTIVGVTVALWLVVIAWPGPPPLWLVILAIVAMGTGGPGSLIGFDFARTFNPLRSLGSANGIVNVGGFTATVVTVFLVGLVLDVSARWRAAIGAPTELYSLDGFRLAFLAQVPVIAFGVVMLVRARRRTRARLHSEEGITVAPLWVVLVRAWRHRRA
jgi:sugar phosphate permease